MISTRRLRRIFFSGTLVLKLRTFHIEGSLFVYDLGPFSILLGIIQHEF